MSVFSQARAVVCRPAAVEANEARRLYMSAGGARKSLLLLLLTNRLPLAQQCGDVTLLGAVDQWAVSSPLTSLSSRFLQHTASSSAQLC